jgi:hypothetical protein
VVAVVTVGVVGLEHLEPVADGEAGRHHQKAAGEASAAGLADGVGGLPGDDHGHDGGFAGAAGQFQRPTHEFRIRSVVGVGKVFQKLFAGLAPLRGDLGEPDGGLYSFDLAEERMNVAELVMTPVLRKTLGVGRDLPSVGVWNAAPLVHKIAKLIDYGGRGVILLILGGEPLAFVVNYLLLLRGGLLLARLGNGGDELGLAAGLDDALRRPAVFVQLLIASGVVIGAVENRPLEKLIVYASVNIEAAAQNSMSR